LVGFHRRIKDNIPQRNLITSNQIARNNDVRKSLLTLQVSGRGCICVKIPYNEIEGSFPRFIPISRKMFMKRYIFLTFVILFCMSACTFLFPAQTNITIARIDHPEDGNLVLYLRYADQGNYITVNGVAYDCVMVDDPSDTLKCSGPSLQPGEKAVIRFYEDEKTTKPFFSLEFDVPEYDEGGEDPDAEDQSAADDLCPDDPQKTAPGDCGCGVADTDTDGDGTPDCSDGCPENPEMIKAGENGCKAVEEDSDNDGIPDSQDKCPDDPEKIKPGECGCGISDTDTDSDGVPDCNDECPMSFSDPIGDPCDHDEDDDGEHDFADGCPLDPDKTDPGYCGCDYLETDRDGDGTPDCVDKCPDDPKKIKPGQCGCGEKDKDSDGDGVKDCKDDCPSDPDKIDPGVCGCGDPDDPVGDPCNHDEDCDGSDDWNDECPFDKINQVKPCGPPCSLCP
jgi:hypothetical protein